VAFQYLHNREEAADLAQEVFIKVYRKLDGFDGGAFLPWLLRLTRNSAIDRLRRIKARPPAEDLPVEDAHDLASSGEDPETRTGREERARLVHRALAGMDRKSREIILLKEIQGLELKEIADMLGTPVGTVKSRSHRARIELARAVLSLDPSYGSCG
jgi:RNA polymerase sigma-70 factor (ECF subfamily)